MELFRFLKMDKLDSFSVHESPSLNSPSNIDSAGTTPGISITDDQALAQTTSGVDTIGNKIVIDTDGREGIGDEMYEVIKTTENDTNKGMEHHETPRKRDQIETPIYTSGEV